MNSLWIDFGIWLSRRGSFKIRFLFYSEVAPVARSSGSTGDDFESFDWRTEFGKIHAELGKQINYKKIMNLNHFVVSTSDQSIPDFK